MEIRKHLLTKRINIQVSPVNDFDTQYVDGVLVINHLNVPEKKVKLHELKEKWPHLSDLELAEVARTQVTSLLHLHLHVLALNNVLLTCG